MSSGQSARLRAISSSSSRSSGCAHWRSSIHTTTGTARGAQPDRRDQRAVQRVAGARGVERVELRRVPEQMEQRPRPRCARPSASGGSSYTRGRRSGHDLAHLGSRLVELQADAGRQPVRDRPPHVGLAVRRALALDDADSGRAVVERGDRFVDEPRLADPGLADHRHHRAVAGGDELGDRLQQRAFGDASDERDLGTATPVRRRRHRAERQPRVLDLLTAPQLGRLVRLEADRVGAQHARSRRRRARRPRVPTPAAATRC